MLFVCVGVQGHTRAHVFVPMYTDMSVCESESEQAKLTILFRFGVLTPRRQAGPMADKWCHSH